MRAVLRAKAWLREMFCRGDRCCCSRCLQSGNRGREPGGAGTGESRRKRPESWSALGPGSGWCRSSKACNRSAVLAGVGGWLVREGTWKGGWGGFRLDEWTAEEGQVLLLAGQGEWV
jgi:hypothetical protein